MPTRIPYPCFCKATNAYHIRKERVLFCRTFMKFCNQMTPNQNLIFPGMYPPNVVIRCKCTACISTPYKNSMNSRLRNDSAC